MYDSTAYLTVDEAAERLGVSTIRLRPWIREKRVEAVLDNQGRWRVRLNGDPSKVPPVPITEPVEAIDVLIGEIMELRLAVCTENEIRFDAVTNPDSVGGDDRADPLGSRSSGRSVPVQIIA